MNRSYYKKEKAVNILTFHNFFTLKEYLNHKNKHQEKNKFSPSNTNACTPPDTFSEVTSSAVTEDDNMQGDGGVQWPPIVGNR